jgi:xylan 1,4-beta-xylosidase
MDINYRYNFEQLNERISYRSGADPVIVNHKGEYFLFVTISGGWWHSRDLLHWNYVTPDKWPMEDMCAPAAVSVRDSLYLFQSTFLQRPIFVSTEPEKGKLIFYNRWLPLLPKDVGPWDPDLFYDEDKDKWYMYWGSSNVYPIYGAELDKKRDLTYKSKYKELIYLHPELHGWERFGKNHTDTIKPFIEGAWMTKYKKKYYLQYAGPGTEFNVYANGTYVGDDPLGPFTYAPYNPISYKPGGFVQGAGHGCTFQDNFGNYWNMGTPWVAVNWNFERRIAMFPSGFDNDDQLFSNTRFGDLPHYLPTKKWNNKDELFTGWMLLNYRKTVTASSQREKFSPAHIADENPRTFWVADSNKKGEWLSIDLGKQMELRAFQINYTDYKSNLFSNDTSVYIQYIMYSSNDGKNWKILHDQSRVKEDHPNAYVELNAPQKARYVKFENMYVPTPNLAVSDIRLFGNGLGKVPDRVKGLKATRQKDERNATITWQPSKTAVGYNVLWGIAPDKLYQTYQVWADEGTTLELRALTLNQSYSFAIEAFNENGVSPKSGIISVK